MAAAFRLLTFLYEYNELHKLGPHHLPIPFSTFGRQILLIWAHY